MNEKPIYVLDTNIIIDYPNIIPNGEVFTPNHPTIDLSNAHLVIPTAVIRELSNFKSEMSDRGRTSREVLKKLRKIAEEKFNEIDDSYNLKNPIKLKNHDQLISILPIRKDFDKNLPFHPSDNDMDGQIILAALTVQRVKRNFFTNIIAKLFGKINDVTILTNDNGLAIRARVRGIKTSRYGYAQPKPYAGRRDLTVPAELFATFWNEKEISLENWKRAMPNEPELIANEFIIMKTDSYPNDYEANAYKNISNIGRYDSEKKAIIGLKYASSFTVYPKNPGQAIFIEALKNPNIPLVICTGPAGTGKTFLSAIYALGAMRGGSFSEFLSFRADTIRIILVLCLEKWKRSSTLMSSQLKTLFEIIYFKLKVHFVESLIT